MATQNPSEIAQLVRDLEDARKHSKGEKKRSFTCKKNTFDVAGTKGVTVDSWKFMDWDYRRHDLPTYARGLFTTRRKDNIPEIAVRGYDKFFNIDETNDTQWRNIENKTRGPYELSVKENGCIIFISALEDDKLLVCSKHSTGVRADTNLSHAQVGERWVERHVATVGKSSKELARTLRQMNVTAVGELCDDNFEEHVLAYDEAAAGIYLHGLNYNQPEFATMSGDKVHEFADAWGFKKAKFVVYDDIASVKKFLEGCAETGTWDGRETEGFVIRCQISDRDSGYRDWFFKYKFEEPYLMYRQWRECTKAIISGKLPKIKKHHKITEEYLQFARREFIKNPKLTQEYNHNHGIISLREKFLNERGLKGSEIIAMEEAGDKAKEATNNIVIAPIASLGCGKTTVALALVHLFKWAHIQNDNIPKQKGKPKQFAFEITQAMATHPVVIADRNNHQRRERKQLMEDIFPVVPDAQFVALHYVHEPKAELLPAIKEVTRKRVLERGDNHQTIRAGSKNQGEIVGIMDGFLARFEGVDVDRDPDMHFQHVIDLDVCASSRENLETVMTALHAAYPRLIPSMPSPEELDAAIDAAIENYEVKDDLSKGYSKPNQKKQKNDPVPVASQKSNAVTTPAVLARKIEYFSISVPTSEITSTLKSLFTNTAPETARLYNQLHNSRRIQPAFHVTLIHRAASKDRTEIWDRYAKQYIDVLTANPVADPATNPPKLNSARVRLERLVWDNRIMAFVVRILPAEGETEDAVESAFPCANAIPHITVGTASPDVKPKESNDLLQRWHEVGSGGETGIFEAEVPGVKLVDGVVGVVMMRGKH
ncbi:Putative TRNA ligase [Penicillium brasilianum]|uniref:tRNA ligase n=1 Tax=Penicillium brasilianum TaxID=104259 RepID=A0A0F7TVA7_PENBI|nr:Putative TRNA ligase [Penicillium brasilianum]